MTQDVVERLETYYPFDEEITGKLQAVAEWHRTKTYTELADCYGLADGPSHAAIPGSKQTLEYYRITPKGDFDETIAKVLFTPMATPADQNMAMRAMRLFAGSPSEELYVFGSPAAIGNKHNRLSWERALAVAGGNLSSAVRPALGHLATNNVKVVKILGYSYGADAGASAAGVACKHELIASQAVLVEPSSSVAQRGLFGLFSSFLRSGKELDSYVAQGNSPALIEARQRADTGLLRYIGGLARPSNLAIGNALTGDRFVDRVNMALKAASSLRVSLGWGAASELTHDERMQSLLSYLRDTHPLRVSGMRLDDMHHAGGDDIDLHAAIMLQGLKDGERPVPDWL